VYRNKKYKAKLRFAWYYLKNLDPRLYFDNVWYNEENEQQSRFFFIGKFSPNFNIKKWFWPMQKKFIEKESQNLGENSPNHQIFMISPSR